MAVGDTLKAERIKAVLITDSILDIDVEVHNGVAILDGFVESERQKHLAEELAHEVEGITEVQNNIIIKVPLPEQESAFDGYDSRLGYGPMEGDAGDTPFSLSNEYSVPGPGIPSSEQFPGEFSEEELESEINDKLKNQKDVDVSGVHFELENQIVDLKGWVETSDDLMRLQEIILSIRGVIGVNSNLSVKKGDMGTPVE